MIPSTVERTGATMTASEAEGRLARLNLAMVRMKLADAEEGPGLSIETVDLLEREYRRFLMLNLLHPTSDICPSKDVDTYWHAHILDTAAYRVDCDAIFGEYLDHYPYFGMRGPEDAQALIDAYENTIELYEQHFGAAPEVWRPQDATKCGRTNCKAQKCSAIKT